jgi:hypothetical protein
VPILFDTGTGNKKKLIDITKLAQQYQQELCTALLGLHAFTRCDTTSAFKGIGKVKPIKTLQKILVVFHRNNKEQLVNQFLPVSIQLI